MQDFEWELAPDKEHWKKSAGQAEALKNNGFTHIWFPPAYKGQAGCNDVGYGVYDMYDLGEFNAKNSIPTKYGTKDEYLQAIKAFQDQGIKVLADVVFNHRMGADEEEEIEAQDVNVSDRNQDTSGLRKVKVWTKFTFPARNDQYSDFKWNWQDFTGTDYRRQDGSQGILIFKGKEWSDNVSKEQGNFDFIMGDDVDFSSDRVVQELYDWGKWYTELTGINGFRVDAVKSIDAQFFMNWLKAMSEYGNHPDFSVGEYWSGDWQILSQYLKDSGHCMKLFDVPLHYHFQQASTSNGTYNMQELFNETLTQSEPGFSVAFVDNHDTQPGQSLQSWVDPWFKPHAYALTLLGECEFPCVFYGDYYGMDYIQFGQVSHLRDMVWIRTHLLGDDVVWFNDQDTQKLCWMVPSDHPVLVIMSIGEGKQAGVDDLSLSGKTLIDVMHPERRVELDENGRGTICCDAGQCSVYLCEEDYRLLEQARPSFEGGSAQLHEENR